MSDEARVSRLVAEDDQDPQAAALAQVRALLTVPGALRITCNEAVEAMFLADRGKLEPFSYEYNEWSKLAPARQAALLDTLGPDDRAELDRLMTVETTDQQWDEAKRANVQVVTGSRRYDVRDTRYWRREPVTELEGPLPDGVTYRARTARGDYMESTPVGLLSLLQKHTRK